MCVCVRARAWVFSCVSVFVCVCVCVHKHTTHTHTQVQNVDVGTTSADIAPLFIFSTLLFPFAIQMAEIASDKAAESQKSCILLLI